MTGVSIVELKIPGITPPLLMKVHDNRDIIVSSILKLHGLWEPAATFLALACIQPGQRILDIGANVGYFTLLYSRLVGEAGRVYAFEPEPENFRLLQANIRLNRATNVELVQLALSDTRGQGVLYVADSNLGDHRLSFVEGRQRISVKISTVDDLFDKPEGTIHFVKIDAQGAEQKILLGMRALIARNAGHIVMLTEYSPRLLEHMGDNLRSLAAILDDLGARAMVFEQGEDGAVELRRASSENLIAVGERLLELPFDDVGTDIVLFFSETAETRFMTSLEKYRRCSGTRLW